MSRRGYFKLSLVIIFLGFIMVSNFFVKPSLAYDEIKTHPLLTKAIIDHYNKRYKTKITNAEAGYIIKGSTDEDVPVYRSLNHFYDPINNCGLAKGKLESEIYYASIDWATSSAKQSNYSDDKSWSTAVYNYQQKNYQAGLTALGNILHLLEDLSVPAHVRDDPHPEGDNYEIWAKNNIKKIDQVARLEKPQCSTLANCFKELALATNQNFFSKDTLNNKKYSLPASKLKQPKKTGYVRLNNKVLAYYNSKTKTYALDDKVSSYYWQLLSKKAIAYGVRMIEIYFKEVKGKKLLKPATIKKTVTTLNKKTKETKLIKQDSEIKVNNQLTTTPPPVINNNVISLNNFTNHQQAVGGGSNVIQSTPINNTNNQAQSNNNPSNSNGDQTTESPQDFLLKTTIKEHPLATTNSAKAKFAFEANKTEANFECSLNNDDWFNCPSNYEINEVTQDQNKISVRSVLGDKKDETLAEYSWLVDTKAPNSKFVDVANSFYELPLELKWSSQDNYTESDKLIYDLQYKIDDNPWQNWLEQTLTTTAKFEQALNKKQSASFRVRAKDEAGNLESWSENGNNVKQLKYTDGLEALWHFNECFKPSFYDSINQVKINAEQLSIVPSLWDCGLYQEYNKPVTANFKNSLDVQELTLSYYYKDVSDFSLTYSRQHVFLKNYDGDKIIAGIVPSNQKIIIYFEGGQFELTKKLPQDNKWHNLVLVYELDKISLYLDGDLFEEIEGEFIIKTNLKKINLEQENGLVVFDELAVWSRVLEDDEIKTNFNKKKPLEPYQPRPDQATPQKIHFWDFETNKDLINNRTISNPHWSDGHTGQGITLSYQDAYIISQNINQLENQDVSLTFWWRNSDNSDAVNSTIFLTNNDNKKIIGLNIAPIRSYVYYDGGEICLDRIVSTDQEWHHFVVVYDSYKFQLLIYVDGKLIKTIAAAWGTRPITDLFIRGGNWSFQLDDLIIWEGSLSEEKVKEIYQE